MSNSKEEFHREYLLTKVNPILTKIFEDLVHEKPDNVLEYVANWVEKRGEG